MKFWRKLAIRALWTLPVIWGVVTLTFIAVHVLSPNPVNLLIPLTAPQSERIKEAAALGLNQPVIEQYFRFLGNLVHGNLGFSYVTGNPVATDLSSRLPATLELAIYAVVTGVVGGVITGVLSAVKRDGWLDLTVRGVTLGGLALPQFWVGLVLLWLLFVKFHILPGPIGRLPVGVTPPRAITHLYTLDALLQGKWELFWMSVRQLILPVFTLGFNVFAPISRVTRSAMIEVLDQEYIRTSVAMGHGKRIIWFKYALKNALLPVITMVGNSIGFAFSGAVLIEGIFAWPGIGQYALNAIQQSDFPAVQGFVLYVSILYVLTYFIIDVVYLRVDPRLRA